jgi:multiple sugar transport system permease protein
MTARRTTAGGRTLSQRDARAGLALISPTVLIITIVVILPIIWTISLAFQDVRLINIRQTGLFGSYTLDNFRTVFGEREFWSTLWTTLLYTVGGTGTSLLLGLIAALALRQPFRGRAFVRGAFLLPYVAPVVAVTFVWTTLLNPEFGLVNDWGQRFLGWEKAIPFLSQSSTALLTVIAFEAWRYFPFAFLFITARLQALPADVEEASRVDGATPFQRFRYIVLPQLMPVLTVLVVLRFIFTFNKFDDVYLLTGGGADTQVASVLVYQYLTARGDIGASAAQALVLAGVLILMIAAYIPLTKRTGESAL